MSELILHHYWQSPFAEKARLLLGFKGLAWRSVIIPRMLPKPELTALTGGYRKTPVLQVGADVYCDTALIARRLDAEKAMPALFPQGQEAVVAAFAAWADSVVFQHAVALIFQPEIMGPRLATLPPEQAQAFLDDRKALFSGGSLTRLTAEQAQQQLPTLLARLEIQLQRSGGDYLFGGPSVADIALAHNFWFLKSTPQLAPLIDERPDIAAWYARVLGFGHGTHEELSADQALEIAREAEPLALPLERAVPIAGLAWGTPVTVAATDYGVDPVAGELVYADSESLVVKRHDERLGAVQVHFPRLNFRVSAGN
ncbi:glutathione S-transferase family protein [Pseudomonas oryzihabitans]|uniref:glutathione S-transferase family protein n=1 Tax=Pseudomonas oryzihabitans TaxID=47885 RepID=UPI0028951BA9|nr:glutathione S-transferase family protein [Pseudomonas oryzihabitans]MDT3721317.1 glutathione S-transferase family protein [Pseudomonas oryzihabitans]